MKALNTETLVAAYLRAIELKMDKRLIGILEKEIYSRKVNGLNVSQIKDQ